MSEPSNNSNSNSNMGMKKWLTAGSMLLPRWTQSMEGWQTHLSTRSNMMMELMWRGPRSPTAATSSSRVSSQAAATTSRFARTKRERSKCCTASSS